MTHPSAEKNQGPPSGAPFLWPGAAERQGTARQLLTGLFDLFWPPACVACRAHTTGRQAPWPLCADCLMRVERLFGPLCAACGQAILHEGLCAACQSGQTPTRFPVRAVARYLGPMREVVLSAKPPRCEESARRLGALLVPLARALGEPTRKGVVVPVPLFPARLRSRGYSLPDRLARTLAKQSGLPYRPEWLIRRRDTPSQVGREPEARLRNVQDAFAASCPNDLSAYQIFLVDDVVTTGATLACAAQPLMERGASLCGLALARA